MHNYFLNLFSSNFPLTPPVKAEQKLASEFPKASNPTWFKQGESFAVVFFIDNRDCMAQFNSSFNIVQYKIKTPTESLPNNIRTKGESEGKIINSILICKNEITHYELTVLTPQLKNTNISLDSNGRILK
jgi:hypothetical protein